MTKNKGGYTRLWGILTLVTVAAIGWEMRPAMLEFESDAPEKLPTIFAYLFLISLFVERAIEVFLSAWRSAGADTLDQKIITLKTKVEQYQKDLDSGANLPEGTDCQDVFDELESIGMTRTQYSADSRFISQWLGLGIGVVISLVGVRVLDSVVITTDLLGNQKGAFVVVDIILTGAVIAGGSDSINKIMKLYNSVMDSTMKKTKL